jgi:hypothetical protein
VGRFGLKMPDLKAYDPAKGERVVHVTPVGIAFQRDRHGSRAQWLHQIRSDLGRLGAIAEIL